MPQMVAPWEVGKQAEGWVIAALQEEVKSLVLATGNRRRRLTYEPQP